MTLGSCFEALYIRRRLVFIVNVQCQDGERGMQWFDHDSIRVCFCGRFKTRTVLCFYIVWEYLQLTRPVIIPDRIDINIYTVRNTPNLTIPSPWLSVFECSTLVVHNKKWTEFIRILINISYLQLVTPTLGDIRPLNNHQQNRTYIIVPKAFLDEEISQGRYTYHHVFVVIQQPDLSRRWYHHRHVQTTSKSHRSPYQDFGLDKLKILSMAVQQRTPGMLARLQSLIDSHIITPQTREHYWKKTGTFAQEQPLLFVRPGHLTFIMSFSNS